VSDTTKTTPFATRDTLEVQPVHSQLYWYSLEDRVLIPADSSRFQIFRLADEKALIYRDFGDIFWNDPLWFAYDLQERGRPKYISFLNKYPHQNTIYLNRVLMNDPTHGMYDVQYLSVNYTRTIEGDAAIGNMNNFASSAGEVLNVKSNTRHTKAPWTKILYKQGSFGYSLLDISFVLPISETIALQLGGFNNKYDGSIINSNWHGYNFRGELTWQYNANLYISGQFYMNRTRVGLTPFSIRQEITNPYHSEDRDDFVVDVTWMQNDSLGQRLHMILYNGYTSRIFQDRDNRLYKMTNQTARYGFDANYNLFFGKMELLLGLGTIYPEIWGDAFDNKYRPYGINTYSTITLPLMDKIRFQGSLQIAFQDEYHLQWLPELRLQMKPSHNHEVELAASRTVRIPNINERFFDFDSLYGNPDLKAETHVTSYASYTFHPGSKWSFRGMVGYSSVDNEIEWQNSIFKNTGFRDFSFIQLQTSYKFWRIDFDLGGHFTFTDICLTPRSSAWGSAHIFQSILRGALKLDAYGSIYFYDKHDNINFEPRLQRFYRVRGENEAYYILNWKIVATVSAAQIFFEMNNALSQQYEVINGYTEFYYRFRFGINWELWD